MRFGEPLFLWLLALAPVVAAFLIWALRRRERDLARWCTPNLWARMVPDRNRWAAWWKALLVLSALLFLALMAARPQLGSRILSMTRRGIDVMIALDTSDSMLAEDLQPNRITRAKQEIQALLDRLRGDRVGLVAFSGEAFVQCPLTLDYAAARMFLRFMDTDLIPVPGTAVAEAIRSATKAFDPKERKFKALVLITDGEDHEGRVIEAAREAKEQGVRIFAIGIGTAKGEPIPIRDDRGGVRDYKRDRQGDVILTRCDPAILREICEETGGRYYDGNTGGLALDRLYAEISAMEQKEVKGGIVTQYEDRYGYFAAAALVLLAVESVLGERRRRRSAARRSASAPDASEPAAAGPAQRTATTLLLLLACLGAALLSAPAARGADRGTREYRKGNYAAARDAYEEYGREHPGDPRAEYNLGTTLHQTGEMGPSEQSLRQALRTTDPKLRAAAFYNLGNTRARAGNLEGAREAYEMALRLQPGDQDAKHNLELVEALLQPPPPDSTQQSQQNQNDQKDQQNPQNKNQNDQNKDQKSQEQQDQAENQQQDQNQQQEQQQQPPPQQEPQQQQQEPGEQQSPQQAPNEQAENQDQRQGRPLEPLKISPEQARQILEGLAQQEMLLQAERLKARSRQLRADKDW